jgi:hypothetical protein
MWGRRHPRARNLHLWGLSGRTETPPPHLVRGVDGRDISARALPFQRNPPSPPLKGRGDRIWEARSRRRSTVAAAGFRPIVRSSEGMQPFPRLFGRRISRS